MQKLEHPRSNTKRRQRIAAYNLKIPRERCPKATDSKAVGGTQPTALPSSPIVPFSWTAVVGLPNRQ